MFKRLLFLLLVYCLAACSAFRWTPQALGSPSPITGTLPPPTPSSGMGQPSATLMLPLIPSHTPVFPTTIPSLTPLSTWTPTVPPSPTPTWQGTPPTPTQLATPYAIEVLDWELVKATSPELCAGCDPGVTTIDAPRGLSIALVQVFIDGEAGARSTLTTDLLYAAPEELACTLQAEDGLCGMVFGQVYNNRVTLSANHTAGGAHKLEYLVTLQTWAGYSP